MPSYISPNELLSITTFDEPNKDATVGIINSKVKTKLKDNEKEKVFNEETGDKYNIHEVDTEANNSKQNFKKRKYSSEKSFVTHESDIKVKKKKKEIDQNITDQQDEKGKAECEDENNTCDNETNVTDNSKQSLKKRKYSSEKSLIADESDIKVKKKKKDMNQSITDQQNEKKKVPKEDVEEKDNEIDTIDNNDKQDIKTGKYVAEKSFIINENDIKVKKKKKVSDQNITYQQNEKEKMPEDPSFEDKVSIYDNEMDITDNNDRQSLKKRKLASEKSSIKDETDIIITGNSNIENQEILNKNRNKITEKKKRKLTIDDTIVADDISGEGIKKECQKPIHSDKNETTELKYLYEGDESNETNTLLQTEKCSDTRDFDMINSDIKETSGDERKKKKNRKKRSKVQNDDCSRITKIGLQIMAKSDWKRLRNRYLDLQRYKMSQLKLHLRKAEVERGGIMTKNGWYHDKTGPNNRLLDKSKAESDNEKLNEEKTSHGRINYVPGIIVKIEMDEPCTNVQSFKVH